VLCKNLTVSRGEAMLFDERRYFSYIPNDGLSPAERIVREANQRCDQENLNAQLKGAVDVGVRAPRFAAALSPSGDGDAHGTIGQPSRPPAAEDGATLRRRQRRPTP